MNMNTINTFINLLGRYLVLYLIATHIVQMS